MMDFHRPAKDAATDNDPLPPSSILMAPFERGSPDGAASDSTGTSTLMADLGWSSGGSSGAASRRTMAPNSFSSNSTSDGDSLRFDSGQRTASNASSTMPWSEDAVDENRQLWQHIEAMLYGERELPPEGSQLRGELLQWRRHFPHLRVRGVAVRMAGVLRNVGEHEEQQQEEVLAIHPQPTVVKRQQVSRTAISLPAQPSASAAASADVERMLEHCLRISSSFWSRRPTTTMLTAARLQQHQHQQQKPLNLLGLTRGGRRMADETLDDDDDDYDDDHEPRINSVRSEIQRVRYDHDHRSGAGGELPAVHANVQRQLPATLSSAYQRRRQFGGAMFVDGSRIGTALPSSHHSSSVGAAGNSAIRRRTILPPIDDRLQPLPSSAGRSAVATSLRTKTALGHQQMRANEGVNETNRLEALAMKTRMRTLKTTEQAMGDLFGRSVSAVYVPPLNL